MTCGQETRTRLVDSLAEVDATDFGRLDPAAGAAACHGRLVQRERDGRWLTRYLVSEDAFGLRAAVPLYTPRVSAWPDPAYDARSWTGIRIEPSDGPQACLLVGSCTDLRGSLHVAADVAADELRQLMAAVAAVAADDGRALVLPYVYDAQRDRVTDAVPAMQWSVQGEEGYFGDLGDPDWRERLRSRERSYLKRDVRLLERVGPKVTVVGFDEVEDEACRLIADHNLEKGRPDHLEFARMRYQEWSECAGVECIVLCGRAGASRGVLAGVISDGRLDLLEIGLDGEEGESRLATYLSLLFHTPFELAAASDLHTISLGTESHRVKSARGAKFKALHCGYLSPSETRALSTGRLSGSTVGVDS